MEGGLVRIEGLGFERAVVEAVCRANSLVIAHGGVAGEHVVDDFLAVDTVFEAQHEVRAAVGRHINQRHEAVAVAGALGAGDFDGLVFGEERHRLGVQAVDRVDLASEQGLRAHRGVADVAQFDRVEVAASGFPVFARLAFGKDPHAWRPFFQRVGTRTIGLVEIGGAGRHDDEVVVRQHIGQVGVAGFHADLDLV